MGRQEWTGEGYPQEYVGDFQTPDNKSVNRVATYLEENASRVEAVVLDTELVGLM